KVSGGLHGVGVSCVNALSESLTATVYRDGKIWEQTYEQGKALHPVKSIGETALRGTMVTFKPDATLFTQITEFSYDNLSSLMRELSFINKGITLTLTDKRQKGEDGEPLFEKFYSDEGLKEFVRYLDGNRDPLIREVIYMEVEKNDIPVE